MTPTPPRCRCGGESAARGTCPLSIACPKCGAPPGAACQRPSGHPAGAMHRDRYRTTERADAAACPGFEPLETPYGLGCARCSGLPEDHGRADAPRVPAGMLF